MSMLRSWTFLLATALLAGCGGGGLDGTFVRTSQKQSPLEVVLADSVKFTPDGNCAIDRITRGNGADVLEKVACTYTVDGNFLRIKVETKDGTGERIQGTHSGMMTIDRKSFAMENHTYMAGDATVAAPTPKRDSPPPTEPAASPAEAASPAP